MSITIEDLKKETHPGNIIRKLWLEDSISDDEFNILYTAVYHIELTKPWVEAILEDKV